MAAPKNPALAHRMRPPDDGRAATRAHHRARLEHVNLEVAHAEPDRAGDVEDTGHVADLDGVSVSWIAVSFGQDAEPEWSSWST